MDIYEITGFKSGVDESGVNFLQPSDAFEIINNGYIYRDEILSRKGFSQFANRLFDKSRVMGIFENFLVDGTIQLLVCSTDFLYKYVPGKDTFDQIPMAGAVSSKGFGIKDPSDYVSGTTCLTKEGKNRFLFTGNGMKDVFFYDGKNVLSFTNSTDNPDYSPPQGGLKKANQVCLFNERLNFFSPTIGGKKLQQEVLYSGTRDSSGKGDKFDVPGSGVKSCDTYETMLGAIILGNIVIMTFERSTWVMEKTGDLFNPYYFRKVPSTIGTDAGFSALSWNHEVKSAGKTGFIGTDGRNSLRFDDKISKFSAYDIDQVNFDLMYGGFDRINGQFLFALKSSNSNLTSETQDQVLVYNYEEKTWSLNDQRFSVFGQTNQGISAVWNKIDETINPSWARWDQTEEIWNRIGQTASTQKTLAGDDLGFVYEINTDFDDYFVNISAITLAQSAVVTIDASAFQIGDRVIFSDVKGMTEINGITGTISGVSETSVTVNIDSSLFTAYITGGNVSKLIDFKAKMVPFNPYRKDGRKCYINMVEFLINTNSDGIFVDIIEDEEQAPFKTAELIPKSPSVREREWIAITVNQESNFFNLVFRKESSSSQIIISSIRIHASPGPLTSG